MPDFQIVPGRQNSHASAAFHTCPASGLSAMLGCCSHKHLSLWIIQCHEIMLIFEREGRSPGGEWMPSPRAHRDRTLFGVMEEHAAQQTPQHGLLLIVSHPGMDG